MSRYFPVNLTAGRNPNKARRESNLRFLTSSPKKFDPKPIPVPQILPPKEPFVPPLEPPPSTMDNEEPSLLPPNTEGPSQEPEDEDEIVFLGEEMGDTKSDSRGPGSVNRDDSRSRNNPEQRERRGNPERHNSSGGDNRRSGEHSQKRDHNGSSKPPRFPPGGQSNSFTSQMRGGMDRQGGPLPMNPAAFTQEIPKKKFTTRCRLFVGNLPNDMKEEEFRELFKEFGDCSETYLSGKGYGFLRLDTRAHAEAAKESLDGKTVKGRQLRVRFAVHGGTIRVKELSPVVSNEMLYNTFSIFGEVERAIHIVDERGKPTGEGIVEFEQKRAAQDALRSIEERVFMMTTHSHPIQVELMEAKDEDDGLSERMIQRTPQSMKEREIPPRFADEKSFEYSYGMRWKELYKREKEQREQLEQQIIANRRQLEDEMQMAFEDYQAEKIREELEQRRRELDRLEEARRNRMTNRPPDFGAPWGAMQQRGFDEPPPSMFNHPPPGPNCPPMNPFDGPNNRPNPTFGREPRFFGGPDPDMRHQAPQEKQVLGADIDKLLQSFRGDEPQHGGRPDMNRNPGFNEGIYGAPPPFNAPLVPPLMSIPPQLMKQNSQSGRHHQMPPEKRSRR